MVFANKTAAGVSKGILRAKHQFGIRYSGQVNLINFYRPRPPYWIRHFHSAILNFLNPNEEFVISDPKNP